MALSGQSTGTRWRKGQMAQENCIEVVTVRQRTFQRTTNE